MIEPNRLSAPGERAAHARVEAVFAAADRLSPEDLQLRAVPRRDPEEREILLADLERVADRHGRGALLDEARDWLREALLTRAIARLTSESGFPGRVGGGRPADQAAILLAIEDAVSVAVVEDLLEAGSAATLADPGRGLLGLAPLAGSAAVAAGDDGPAWEPSTADWAAAAAGDTRTASRYSPPGTRGMRAVFFGAIAVSGSVAAIAWGLTEGSIWLGGLLAVAVVALCWTFATWRPRR
ncbi:MAG: hypothetical protein ACYC65_01700 [Candidatus Limnocylindrales bacterium]